MDWEHLSFFNSKANENPKFQPSNWGIKLDREINVGLFDTPGGSGCSESELVHCSISRSSKSASISSSPNRDSKTCLFTFESSQDDSNGKIELSKEEQIETCYAPELSSVSGEPLLSLKLGKRMYFEDVCPESDSKNVDFSKDLVSSLSIGKKCKSNGQSSQCQVEGCGIDLSSAKDYHRKKRICESHAKSPKVVVAGLERRFCQQCSRFHALFEFDGKKRSCRQRLSHHNARRRKPRPPKDGQSSQSALTSSPCDDKQQMSPFAHSRTATNLAWQNIHNSKLPQTKDFHLEPAKDNIDIPSTVTMLFDDSKSINPGVEDFITFSDTNATQDFSCALSLLSTNLWDSYETKSIYPEPSNRSTSIAHAMSQHMPLDSSEYWHSDHDQQVNSSMWISNSNREDSNRFQEFQLFRRPYEFGFHQLD